MRLRQKPPRWLNAVSYRLPRAVGKVLVYPSGSSYPLCPRCGRCISREYVPFCDQCGQHLTRKLFSLAKEVPPSSCSPAERHK